MFIYLSKKIAIPNGVRLKSISWNTEQGWIACGGEDGLLKVLKLDTQVCPEPGRRGVAAPSNLSMNQTLDGHGGAVICVAWNAIFQKLTTSDESGLIIVWMLHKGMWFEEMINNRNKSVVRDMAWNPDGGKICICYEDGAVIVGSVDGNRLWGDELGMTLAHVAWSPDGRHILFVTKDSEVNVFDNKGKKISTMRMPILDRYPNAVNDIVGVHWYDGMEGHVTPDAPSLAIALSSGHVQVSRHSGDESPVFIDTGLDLRQCQWNANGSVLALAGAQEAASGKVVSVVRFYTPHGQHIKTLKVPGNGIEALTWEGTGLRIALAVDSFIYFANLRPDYLWGHFANTLCFSFNRPGREEQCVVFWDTATDERHVKYFGGLVQIRAAGDNCVLLRRATADVGASAATSASGVGEQHILVLCDSIGTAVDEKIINFRPSHITMTKHHVVCANDHAVYVWRYRTQISKLTSAEHAGGKGFSRREGRERMIHIDDPASQGAVELKAFNRLTDVTSDPISCIGAGESCLVVGRRSGALHKYSLPHIALDNRFAVDCEPARVSINSDGTKLAIVDTGGVLSFFDMEAGAHGGDKPTGEALSHQRKDVWDVRWADDNPGLLVCMEKLRLTVLRYVQTPDGEGDFEAEEPLPTSGYICSFKDLCVTTAMLDEVMENPLDFEDNVMVDFETKTLREAREMLADIGVRGTVEQVEDMEAPHPRLWRLLAHAALEELDLTTADKAFVHCEDYRSIQFVKRLRALDDRMKQKAEISVFFNRFDEAESMLREIDRKDLAIELRARLGDWFRVVQLVQSGGGDDEMLSDAWSNLGDYHAARQEWAVAAQHYAKAKNTAALVDCHFHLEQYPQLSVVSRSLPDSSRLLLDVAGRFQAAGLCDAAVDAYVRAGDPKRAVDCCVLLNRWGKAVELAEQHRFPQVEGMLSKYSTQLLEKGKTLAAVELYRSANKSPEAAKLLAKMAHEEGSERRNLLRAKKLQVLAALEVERFRKRVLEQQSQATSTSGVSAAQATATTLASLMTESSGTAGEDRVMDSAWRGAEAFHFLMLAQRQLYAQRYAPAMKTALRLAEYEDVLDPREVYSLIALAAYYSRHFAVCSQAFCRLESLEGMSAAEREEIEALALAIFTQHKPVDIESRNSVDSSFNSDCVCQKCGAACKDWHTQCDNCGEKFAACVATGAAIVNADANTYRCNRCRHYMLVDEVQGRTSCPLCHAALDDKQFFDGFGPGETKFEVSQNF